MCSPSAVRMPLSLLALAAVLEGKHEYRLFDGNITGSVALEIAKAIDESPGCVVGISVMPGPQVATAIEISQTIRAHAPKVPIVWGGYFPTMYPDSALNAPYVDYLVRGQGEDTLLEFLACVADAGPPLDTLNSATDTSALHGIAGLSWKGAGAVIHNRDRHFRPPDDYPAYPYERLGDVEPYMRPSFMGKRTGVHQAAIGCRYRCEFCGVVSMYNGVTRLQAPERLLDACTILRDRYGATAMQFYDNNFFDTEAKSVPLLEALGKVRMPWWCYARADTLANLSTQTWELIRKSRLTMTFIGAEAASDDVLKGMRKGTRVDHTMEVARRCFEYGVIPEFSFVLGGPTDPEGEIEKTLGFIKRLKAVHPRCEVILYFYSPTPRLEKATAKTKAAGLRMPVLDQYGPAGPELPATPEEWTQQQWLNYVCHQDAPWLSDKMRQRVHDFATVLGCRFPTVQDYRVPRWGKTVLSCLAQWRYHTGIYAQPWELNLAKKLVSLRVPQRDSL
ncbi:MAG: radical SAM protein [Gammaproteobacteria bacterium]|nr:radical SAM protein [Gammaproteobacteria bacterium]